MTKGIFVLYKTKNGNYFMFYNGAMDKFIFDQPTKLKPFCHVDFETAYPDFYKTQSIVRF
ncbi:MAG TPA: hypothetical protein DCQ93_04015 [Bacteroidetes bacterium]|nr:hypothetical protein [Bacteroidota bacterium]